MIIKQQYWGCIIFCHKLFKYTNLKMRGKAFYEGAAVPLLPPVAPPLLLFNIFRKFLQLNWWFKNRHQIWSKFNHLCRNTFFIFVYHVHILLTFCPLTQWIEWNTENPSSAHWSWACRGNTFPLSSTQRRVGRFQVARASPGGAPEIAQPRHRFSSPISLKLAFHVAGADLYVQTQPISSSWRHRGWAQMAPIIIFNRATPDERLEGGRRTNHEQEPSTCQPERSSARRADSNSFVREESIHTSSRWPHLLCGIFFKYIYLLIIIDIWLFYKKTRFDISLKELKEARFLRTIDAFTGTCTLFLLVSFFPLRLDCSD